jgi:hypothetical protein
MAGHINQMKIVVIYDADIRSLARACKPFVQKMPTGDDREVTREDFIALVSAAVNVCGILISNPAEFGITLMHMPIIQETNIGVEEEVNNAVGRD